MNRTIFREGLKLYTEDKVNFKGLGNNREFYDVVGVGVEVRYDESGARFICTCKNCSIYSEASFCSYKASVIYYLGFKRKRNGQSKQ